MLQESEAIYGFREGKKRVPTAAKPEGQLLGNQLLTFAVFWVW